jgi:hypothetical protein
MIVKYRTWYRGIPPSPIKLQIPGWAGMDKNHSDGAIPQPWHCPPFVDGSTYGHELIYPFKSECRVSRIRGELVFEGDFSAEDWMLNEQNNHITGDESKKKTPPMMSFAPGHYGMSSSLDMEPPDGYVIRTEPHPRFYTDDTGTVPCMLAGHIQRWWSRIFFVVFKAPREGETHIFREGEPYGQVLFVPQKNNVEFVPFTDEERIQRESRDRKISEHGDKISNHSWKDHKCLKFDDKYKVLSSSYAKGGYGNMDKTINEKVSLKNDEPIKTKIPKKLFRAKK